MNHLFKSSLSSLRTDRSLAGLCKHLIETFLPEMFQKYRSANIMFSSAYKLYDQSIPAYLKDRPHGIIKHCMKRLSAGKSDFSERDIQKRENVFVVQSASSKQRYQVNIGSTETFPQCSCDDYQKWYLPCKHFFAIFNCFPGFSWQSLPAYYRNSPYMILDDDFCTVQLNAASEVRGKHMDHIWCWYCK